MTRAVPIVPVTTLGTTEQRSFPQPHDDADVKTHFCSDYLGEVVFFNDAIIRNMYYLPASPADVVPFRAVFTVLEDDELKILIVTAC